MYNNYSLTEKSVKMIEVSKIKKKKHSTIINNIIIKNGCGGAIKYFSDVLTIPDTSQEQCSQRREGVVYSTVPVGLPAS